MTWTFLPFEQSKSIVYKKTQPNEPQRSSESWKMWLKNASTLRISHRRLFSHRNVCSVWYSIWNEMGYSYIAEKVWDWGFSGEFGRKFEILKVSRLWHFTEKPFPIALNFLTTESKKAENVRFSISLSPCLVTFMQDGKGKVCWARERAKLKIFST